MLLIIQVRLLVYGREQRSDRPEVGGSFEGLLKLARIMHRKLRMMNLNVRSMDHTEKEFEDKQTGLEYTRYCFYETRWDKIYS